MHRCPASLQTLQTTRLALFDPPPFCQLPPEWLAQVFCVSERRGPTRRQSVSRFALYRPHLFRGRAGAEARTCSATQLRSRSAHTQQPTGCSTRTPEPRYGLLDTHPPPPRPFLHQQLQIHAGHSSRQLSPIRPWHHCPSSSFQYPSPPSSLSERQLPPSPPPLLSILYLGQPAVLWAGQLRLSPPRHQVLQRPGRQRVRVPPRGSTGRWRCVWEGPAQSRSKGHKPANNPRNSHWGWPRNCSGSPVLYGWGQRLGLLPIPFDRENWATITLFPIRGLLQVGDCLDGVIHTHPSCDLVELRPPLCYCVAVNPRALWNSGELFIL